MKLRKTIESLMFIGLVLAGVAVQAEGTTLSGSYQFGPGTTANSNDSVTLNLPARTNVNVILTLQRNLTGPNGIPVIGDVPVIIDVIKPDGSVAASQNASANFISAGVPIPQIPMPAVFSSQTGCPGVWRVRVRTPNGGAPAARVFGTVTYNFFVPGAVNLDMVGGTLNLDGGSNSTKTLSGKELVGSNGALIAGTGTFRIKAKWHTDPLDVFNFGKFFRLTVSLLRPNGTTAASETGYSQHASSGNTPKINFTYTVTAADDAMSGSWKLKVSSGSSNPRIVNFDVERGFDPNSPSFTSTFQAGCTSAPAIG